MSSGWLGVEPRHLAALAAVGQEGSFKAAAMRLGVVQSAVSQRIAQLEHMAGVRLVERSRGQTSLLTDAGTRLVEHAGEILAELDAALADLRATALDPAPPLRVGAYESVASLLIPSVIRRLEQEPDDLAINLYEDTDWHKFFPLVSSGELDVAFADLPLADGPFAYSELTLDPCVLVVRADSPLAHRREAPTLVEIGALPLIAPSWPMLQLMSDHFRAAGVEPNFVYRSEINSGVQTLVAHGMGAALMPRLAVNELDAQIAVIPLDGVLPARRIAVYWHRDRRACQSIMRFVEALEDICVLERDELGLSTEDSTATPIALAS